LGCKPDSSGVQKIRDVPDTAPIAGYPSRLSVNRDAEIARVTQSADYAGAYNQP